MVDKIIEKIGEKAFAALCAAVAAIAAVIVEEIRKYYDGLKKYQKGRDDERELWKEKQLEWEKRVHDIKESTILTLREKMKLLLKLKKEFEEYKKKHPN